MFKSKPGAMAAVADHAKSGKPMISGSLAMMLKGMGVSSEHVEQTARDFIGSIEAVGDRLAAIEAYQSVIDAKLAAIMQRLDEIVAHGAPR